MEMPRPRAAQPGTLGHVLYGGGAKPLVFEREWVALARRVAARDQTALHALYERAHRAVFTLLMRKTGERKIAEELTLETFHDVWRRAPDYDAQRATVLGWIMNLARMLAAGETTRARQQSDLSVLTADEREAIELTWFSALTHAEAAARLDRPLGTVKSLLRSGLHKLRQSPAEPNRCEQSSQVSVSALQALSPGAEPEVAAHIASCPSCRRERESLLPVIETLAYWPAKVLRPAPSLHQRLAGRISIAAGTSTTVPPQSHWREPEWEEVAKGIFVKMLANDDENDRVSMLVSLLPNVDYPPHTHAGLEELHHLDGELWIDERKVLPGGYNRAIPGTGDKRVWTETGCTCVLITSTRDVLG